VVQESGGLDKYSDTAVKFVSQKEVKGSRLQPTKVIVTWNISAPASAFDGLLLALKDSNTGLRKWAERKGLPEVAVVSMTITAKTKPQSRFRRAVRKVGMINRFSSSAERSAEAGFERSSSAPGGASESPGWSQAHLRTSADVETEGGLGGFRRTPSAPGAVGVFSKSPSAPSGHHRTEDNATSPQVAVEGGGIVEPLISPGMTTKVNQHNLAITRTSSGGVYVHPTAPTRKAGIFPFSFSRAQSAVQSELAYEDSYFSQAPLGSSVENPVADGVGFSRASSECAEGGGGFSRASSTDRAKGLLRQASTALGNVFSRASSRADTSGEDRFTRSSSREGAAGRASSGNDAFVRTNSRVGSVDLFTRALSEPSADSVGNGGETGGQGRGLLRRTETGGDKHEADTGVRLPTIQKNRTEQMEAEGPRTPVMHIEPRRLGIKQAYKKPVLPVAVKPKSSGGATDEFGR